MPVVTNTIKYPNGTVAAGRVAIDLVGTNGRPLTDGAFVSGSDYAIEASYSADLASGVWSVTLVANDLINPAGTRWRVTESVDGRLVTYYVEVPDAVGPHLAEDILDEAPGTIASSALSAHMDDASAHTSVDLGEQVQINSLGKPVSHTNWNTKNQSSADWGGTEVTSTTAQNNEITFAFSATAGTYTLSVFHKLGPSRGIYTIYIDDVALATTVDGYAASITPTGGTADIDNVVLATSGRHTLKFKMETKNATSTGYLGCLNGFQTLTRTA